MQPDFHILIIKVKIMRSIIPKNSHFFLFNRTPTRAAYVFALCSKIIKKIKLLKSDNNTGWARLEISYRFFHYFMTENASLD